MDPANYIGQNPYGYMPQAQMAMNSQQFSPAAYPNPYQGGMVPSAVPQQQQQQQIGFQQQGKPLDGLLYGHD
jgi:hypothetical protein